MKRSGFIVLALVVVTAAIVYVSRTGDEGDAHPPARPPAATSQPPTAPPPPPAPLAAPTAPAQESGVTAPTAAPAAAPPQPAAAARDDVVAMETLRELLDTEPLRAIELARQANRRAPDSPDAPERAWIIVKALAGLKRFHEARDEAATMAGKYPDSSWAMDAKRHLLVQPLDLPSREEQQRQQQR